MSTRTKFLLVFNLALLILAMFFFDEYTFTTTKSGLKYKTITPGMTVIKPKEGQLMVLNVVCKTSSKKDRKEIFTTRNGMPLVILCNNDSMNAKDGGFNEAISILTNKDRVMFKMPAEKVFEDNFDSVASQYNISKDTVLLLDIELTKILDQDDYQQWLSQKMMDIHMLNSEEIKNKLREDCETIDRHIRENSEYKNTQVHTTESGLRYIVYTEGTGRSANDDTIATVNYIGMTINGEIFDTSLEKSARECNKYNPDRKYEPIKFKVGVGKVIKGWDQILPLMKKGTKLRVFIPSVLAYGDRSVPGIPNNSILIFDMELLKIEG